VEVIQLWAVQLTGICTLHRQRKYEHAIASDISVNRSRNDFWFSRPPNLEWIFSANVVVGQSLTFYTFLRIS